MVGFSFKTHDADGRGHEGNLGHRLPAVLDRKDALLILFRIAHDILVGIGTVPMLVAVIDRIRLEILQNFFPKGMALPVVGLGQLKWFEPEVVPYIQGIRIGGNEGPDNDGRGFATVAGQVQGVVSTGILGADPSLAVVGLEASADPRPVFLQDLVVQLGLCEAHGDAN